jgi:FkbM family methyltransferase
MALLFEGLWRRSHMTADEIPTPNLLERLYAAHQRLPRHRGQHRLGELLRRILGRQRVLVETRFGKMSLDVCDIVQHHILARGAYETHTVAAIERALKPGDCVVDVGSHVGQYTLAASRKVGAHGRVVAIEPNPETFLDLQTNILLNRATNVQVVHCAIGSCSELASFMCPPSTNRGSSRRVNHDDADYWVGSLTLPDVMDRLKIRRIDLLKIDVEGAEFDALAPLIKIPSLRPRQLFFEFLPGQFDYRLGAREFLGFLETGGYALFDILGRPYTWGGELPEHNVWARLERDAAPAPSAP